MTKVFEVGELVQLPQESRAAIARPAPVPGVPDERTPKFADWPDGPFQVLETRVHSGHARDIPQIKVGLPDGWASDWVYTGWFVSA
ncbi:hypothetical protein HJC99_06440 [Candidatus Saccharibacteria bacterium]|nr:hypothetical protein [Candidatus Saccharibacteria bacterium]